MFLSEGRSLRRQITFPKVSTRTNTQEDTKDDPDNEMIMAILKDLGKI